MTQGGGEEPDGIDIIPGPPGSPDRRRGRGRREITEPTQPRGRRRRITPIRESEEPPAAIGQRNMTELDRLGIGHTHHRCGMEAGADRQPPGEIGMCRLASEQ